MKDSISDTGIVTGKRSSGDRSSLFTVLTSKNGSVAFKKFGAGSKKDTVSAVLQPMNVISLKLLRKKKGYELTDVQLENGREELKKDHKKIYAALNVLKVLNTYDLGEDKDTGLIYMLTDKFLSALDTSSPCLRTVTAYFYYQLAWCLGTGFSTVISEGPYKYLEMPGGTFYSSSEREGREGSLRISDSLYWLVLSFSGIRFADTQKLDYITEKTFNEFRSMYGAYTEYHFNKNIHIKPADIEGDRDAL